MMENNNNDDINSRRNRRDIDGVESSSCCCWWHKMILYCLICLIILSLWYCIVVFRKAAEACYVIPCYEGPGWQALWKLNKGVTFTDESSGIYFIFHSLVGYILFYKIKLEDFINDAHFIIGIFMGCTGCAMLLSLNMIWVYGAECNLISNLIKINPKSSVFIESNRQMIVNESLIGTFTLLSYLSTLICTLQLLLVLFILLSRKSITNYFHLLGGNSTVDEETIPLNSMLSSTTTTTTTTTGGGHGQYS